MDVGQLQRGRVAEAEVEFERLLGGPHVKLAMAELSRSERGDDGESIKYSELFYGRHFRGIHYMRRALLNLCCSILICLF